MAPQLAKMAPGSFCPWAFFVPKLEGDGIMKVQAEGNRVRVLLAAAPLTLMLIATLAFGGFFNGAASAQYGGGGDQYGCWGGHPAIISPFGIDPATGNDFWDTPNKCSAEPWGVNDNPVKDMLQGTGPDDIPIDGYYTADDLINGSGTGLLQDQANKGKVHVLDVRVPQEDVTGIAPCLTALGIPTYNNTNLGHPIWQWPDGSWEESFFAPVFAGYSWAGTQRIENGQVLSNSYWARNVRPQPNPNFVDIGAGSYLRALVDQQEISKDDTIVVMCQSGWRASFAATMIKNQGFKHVYVLYGGMLGWSDDYYNDDFQSTGDPDNTAGPAFDRAVNPEQGDRCAPGKRCKYVPTYDQQQAAVWNPLFMLDRYSRYTYNINRLVLDGQVPMWDGKETHIGVAPEWLAGFGAMDFRLKANPVQSAYWASDSDRQQGILTVTYSFRNEAPEYIGALLDQNSDIYKANYTSECGGAPLPLGQCHPVLFDPWGPAQNARITSATATDGVMAVDLTGGAANGIGIIPQGLSGSATVKYHVPAGVTSFRTNPQVEATNVADARMTMFGANMAFFFTYHYTHFDLPVSVPDRGPVSQCGRPALSPAVSNVRWASFADFLARRLSVDYALTNLGDSPAMGVLITGATGSNGATTRSSTPISLGDMGAGSLQRATITFTVPVGLMTFRATISASASDSCGGSYSY